MTTAKTQHSLTPRTDAAMKTRGPYRKENWEKNMPQRLLAVAKLCAQLEIENAELPADARRYRLLRSRAYMKNADSWSNVVSIALPEYPGDPLSVSALDTGQQLDVIIDQAIAANAAEKGR